MTDSDWNWVIDACNILRVHISKSLFFIWIETDTFQDSNCIQQYFSSEKQPTLWRALPALEELQTAWEKKSDSPRFALYKDTLNHGLKKLKKYYSRLDEKPSFVLALGTILPSYDLLLTSLFTSFTHTTNSHTSSSHGEVLKRKKQR